MFERNMLWRHKTNKTVAMQVVVQDINRKAGEVWKLIVTWWNVGACHNPWSMNVTQAVEIPDEKLSEWIGMDMATGRVENPNYNNQEWP